MTRITHYGPGDEATWGPVMSSRDPRYEDNGCWSEEEADDMAKEEALATPTWLAEWLNESCDRNLDGEPVEVNKLAHLPELKVGQLLVMLFAGERTAEVIDELQERYLADPGIKESVALRSLELQQELAE